MTGELSSEFQKRRDEAQGQTIYDLSVPGRRGMAVPRRDIPRAVRPPEDMLREGDVLLPEVSEPQVVAHYTQLSRQNVSIGVNFYPLGSCTMKYNPRQHEGIIDEEGFSQLHPDQPEETMQGALAVVYGMQRGLARITGMHEVSVAPMAGAQGELAGLLMIKKAHELHGESRERRKILIPDSAHGTNPATATMAGYEAVEIKSDKTGDIDLADLRDRLDGSVAGMMITYPSTLGFCDRNIEQIAYLLHQQGAYLYMDGANLNAIVGQVLVRELGVDVGHSNMHKTFTGPHGGGGPGAGPVFASEELAPFLPYPVVNPREDGLLGLGRPEHSIGRMGAWYGNFGVILRAYSYMMTMGEEGLREVSEQAVVNANYLQALLKPLFETQYGEGRHTMHEVVFSHLRTDRLFTQRYRDPEEAEKVTFAQLLKSRKVTVIEMAKRMLDYGFHPPTVHFPLIVEDALMAEPTETVTKEAIDEFAEAIKAIAMEVVENPELVLTAPHLTPVTRLDEATAARKPVLRWKPKDS